jgi:hypothetical protein
MAAVLVVGEASALHVIAADDVRRGWKWIVGSSMTLGGLGVLMPIR